MPEEIAGLPTVPPDDPTRKLAIARLDEDASESLPHIGLVGDT